MECFIYRSPRREDTYLYLAKKDDFTIVPEALMTVFGEPQFSFSFELHLERKLVREDARQVMDNLDTRGFHLQMPAENEEPF